MSNKVGLKFPKPKKVKKSTLKKKCDVLFSTRIRSIGFCVVPSIECKHGGQLQCAHIISRWNLRLRWDEMNALCLCAGHHRFYTTRPLEWAELIKNLFSAQYTYVMRHKNELNEETLEDTYKRLTVGI